MGFPGGAPVTWADAMLNDHGRFHVLSLVHLDIDKTKVA